MAVSRENFFNAHFSDLAYNVGLIYYYYPGGKAQNPHNTSYNTGEVYLELSYNWLSIKYSQTITNYFGTNSDNRPFNFHTNLYDPPNGSSIGSIYIEANATFDLANHVCFRYFEVKKLILLTHIGHQTIRHYSNWNYTDWKITFTQEFVWFNTFISYVGTNGKDAYYDFLDNAYHPRAHNLVAQGFVFGVIKNF